VHIQVIWTEGPDGNIAHLAEHDVSPEEAEQVLREPIKMTVSRTSGRSISIGFTESGRHLAVVYEDIDDMTVYPITAYDID
jgi:uncharacterized DUF497 family protein